MGGVSLDFNWFIDEELQQQKERRMEDNKFWIKVWTKVTLMFIVFTISTTSCVIHDTSITTKAISEAIKDGKDPVAVRCAITGFNSDNAAKAVICSKK